MKVIEFDWIPQVNEFIDDNSLLFSPDIFVKHNMTQIWTHAVNISNVYLRHKYKHTIKLFHLFVLLFLYFSRMISSYVIEHGHIFQPLKRIRRICTANRLIGGVLWNRQNGRTFHYKWTKSVWFTRYKRVQHLLAHNKQTFFQWHEMKTFEGQIFIRIYALNSISLLVFFSFYDCSLEKKYTEYFNLEWDLCNENSGIWFLPNIFESMNYKHSTVRTVDVVHNCL